MTDVRAIAAEAYRFGYAFVENYRTLYAQAVDADDPLIRSARGAVLADRGELVVRLRATVDPDADLGAVVATCDGVLADLAHVLPADQLRSRVELSVLRRGEVGPRVR